MSKIELENVLGTYDVTKINANFDAIKDVLDNRVLYRDNPIGQANQMKSNIDMNGKRIFNLPAPIYDNEPLRRGDVIPNVVIDNVRITPIVLKHSGDGVKVLFDIPFPVLSVNYLDIHIDGLYQHKSTYNVDDTTIIFGEAPPQGVNNIEVYLHYVLPLGQAFADATSYTTLDSQSQSVKDALDDLFEYKAATDVTIAGLDSKLVQVSNKVQNAFISAKEYGAVSGVQTDQSSKLQGAWEASAATGATLVIDGVFWVALNNRTYPDGLVRKVGLQVPSNSRCIFAPGAAIKTLPTDAETGYTINAYLADNFEIINPVVYGERNTHIGTTGEWLNCFNIVNCTNAYLHRPVAYDAWGDGIYVGIEYFSATNKQSKNVTLFEPRVYNARRNGYSITSGIDLKLIRPYAEGTSGAFPQAGLDLEPEGAGSVLPVCENWLIESPQTKNCAGAGISVYTETLPTNSKVDIKITNHKDYGSTVGAVVQHGANVVRGTVVFTSPNWEKSRANGCAIKTVTNGPRLYIIDPIIEDCGDAQAAMGWTFDSAINITRDAGEPTTPVMGNFSVTGLRVRDTRTVKKTSFAIHSMDATNGNAGNFKDAIIEVVEDSGTYPGRMALFKQPDASVRISIADSVIATADLPRTDNLFFRSVKMGEAAPANVNVTLGAMRQPLSAIKMCQAWSFGILPQADSRIYPLAVGVGKGIYSNDPGASINLHPTGAKDWIVEVVSGNWVAIP